MKSRIGWHLVAVIILGVLSQIGQVLLLRELLMVFQGNELSIGLILAAWLAWVGIGSLAGSLLLNRSGKPLFLLTINGILLLFFLPGTILLIRNLRGFLQVLPGSYLSILEMALASFFLLAPTCLLIGSLFVLLADLWKEKEKRRDTISGSKAYMGEAFGNMLGGVLFTFFLVHYLPGLKLSILVVILLLFSILLLLKDEGKIKEKMSSLAQKTLVILILLATLSIPFLDILDDWAYQRKWRAFSPHHQLVGIFQSKHGLISILKREDQYSFFQSGHLIFSMAGPTSSQVDLEEQEALTFAHLSLVLHKNPKEVLLIGGGLGGTLREILKHPIKTLDYVELDEVLLEAARPYLSQTTSLALHDARVNLLHTDGRLFIKESKEKYHLILVHIPDPGTAVLNRFYTREFFQEAKDLLYPDGVLVIGVTSTPNLRGLGVANRNATLFHTLNSVFPYVLALGDTPLYYAASTDKSLLSLEASALSSRFLEREVLSLGFSHHHYFTLFEKSQLLRLNWILRHHGRSPRAHERGPLPAPFLPIPLEEQVKEEGDLSPVEERYFINSDFKPLAYYYTLMFWDELTQSGQRHLFLRFLKVEPYWIFGMILPLILVVFLLEIPGSFRKKKVPLRFAILLTVLTTGLSTMSLQVALLFSFQSIYGFVYETIGLIIAIFMGGLASGTLFTHIFIKEKEKIRTLALVQLVMALLSGIIAFFLPKAGALQSPTHIFFLFSLLTLLAGFINGIDFPLATASYQQEKGKADRSVGIIYGVELLGACMGAAVSSLVIIPILGITYAALLAAVASGTAFLILFLLGGIHREEKK